MVITGSSSIPSNKDVIYVSSGEEEEEEAAGWLPVLLQTKFWSPCKDHWKEHRGKGRQLCLYCYEVVCPHCMHNEPGHRLLKVCRYLGCSVILVKDMHDLDLDTDVSGIQENADTSLGDFSETEAVLSVVLALPAPRQPQPVDASPLEDQSDTDESEAEHEYEQAVVVGVPKPPSPALQQPEGPLAPAPVAEAPCPQQLEAPPAPVADQHQLADHPVPVRRRPRKMKHPVRFIC